MNTLHYENDRRERAGRIEAWRKMDNAEVIAYFDCGNYGNSGRYEFHELWSNATETIYNKDGQVITEKFLTAGTLKHMYAKYYYDLCTDTEYEELTWYAARNRREELNH